MGGLGDEYVRVLGSKHFAMSVWERLSTLLRGFLLSYKLLAVLMMHIREFSIKIKLRQFQ